MGPLNLVKMVKVALPNTCSARLDNWVGTLETAEVLCIVIIGHGGVHRSLKAR